jgi:uncharacterized protein YidB (DUF937 family)
MGLMDILNGMQNGPRGQTKPGQGGMSPITMAILALLAYKAYGKMTGGQAQAQPQGAPAGRIPPGTPATQAGGGLGDLLGGLLGGGAPNNPRGMPLGSGRGDEGFGGLGSALGGLLAGGAAGSMLNGGLQDVLESLQRSGQGDVADSWVSAGQNKQISPQALGNALGDDTVNSLAEQAGLSKIDLLDGLSQQLPQFVDQLTPNGRMPTDDEMQRMI